MFRAVKRGIGNRCTASGDLYIRISGINRVLFSYCFRQFLRFRSDIHCFDCWRLVRDFSVTASLTVIYRYFSAIRAEDSKVFRNCIDASAIFTFYTRNLNPNFSGCRNRIFAFDIPALDLTSFEWTYVLPYARINFPFVLPSICLRDMGKTKLIREATCEGHISCRLRGMPPVTCETTCETSSGDPHADSLAYVSLSTLYFPFLCLGLGLRIPGASVAGSCDRRLPVLVQVLSPSAHDQSARC